MSTVHLLIQENFKVIENPKKEIKVPINLLQRDNNQYFLVSSSVFLFIVYTNTGRKLVLSYKYVQHLFFLIHNIFSTLLNTRLNVVINSCNKFLCFIIYIICFCTGLSCRLLFMLIISKETTVLNILFFKCLHISNS